MGAPAPPRRSVPFYRVVRLLLAVAVLVVVVRLIVGGGESERAVMSPSPSVGSQRSPPPLPPCTKGDALAKPEGYDEWQRTLVDTYFALRLSYAPSDLVSVGEAGFEAPYEVRGLLVPDLGALRDAAAAANSPLDISAAYRSYAQQASLYHRRVKSEGREEAVGKTARPGHSEHQLGTTVDFKTLGAADVDRSWERTPAGAWMAANAWMYGFVQSYPRRSTDRTCYWYEPWHYRYFGRDVATQIHDSGLAVREFLWRERG